MHWKRCVRQAFVGVLACMGMVSGLGAAPAGPQGEITIAFPATLAPSWLDPAEYGALLTPMLLMYAIHDALVKPMPGTAQGACLAEHWTESPDGLVYEFTLRPRVTFHNGQPVTAEDVKFSFERYQGVSASLLREKVQAVEIVDARRIRLRLKEPWPDFMAFYGTLATGAAWVVPKAYVEKVGPDGFRKHPVGAGPYKFVRQDPGIAMVVEAYEGYWRMTPAVKRIIFKSVPEDTTRLAMLKTGEADIAQNLLGPAAEEVRRDPRLRLVPVPTAAVPWVDFFSQWDPKSPWHDVRVRLAANHAIDRRAIIEAESLGHGLVTGSIIPREFEFALPIEPYAYDPERAKQLLREAGYPNGLDAREIATGTGFSGPTEATAGYLRAVGIRVKIRSLERAALQAARREKTLKDLAFGGTGALGNAATRLENFVIGGGSFTYGSYADLDELFHKAARELDRTKREQMLHEIQRQVHERAIFAPIWQLTLLNGVGPRLVKSPYGDIPLYPFPGPYEEIQLKGGQ